MENLRNCFQCGKLFAYLGKNLCPACINKEEEDYQLVRKYLRDNNGASIREVAQATDVEEEKIFLFLRDGRINTQGIKWDFYCEHCGKSIKEGRFCQNCLLVLDNELKKVLQTGRTTDNSYNKEGMHIKVIKPKY